VYVSAWWRRVGAYLIDLVIVGIPVGILEILINSVTIVPLASCSMLPGVQSGACVTANGGFIGRAFALEALIGILGFGLYYGIMDGGRRGQTVGKMAAGITLRDVDTGGTVGFWRAALRPIIWTLFSYAFLIPGALNFLWAVWDPRHQC